MKEIWKDIDGYEGLYQISSFGSVKALSRYKYNGFSHYQTKETIKKLTKNAQGYHAVGLSKDRRNSTKLVHRLVAFAFLDNPNNFNVVHHKDNNRINNNVDNLELTTLRQNLIYAIEEKRHAFGERAASAVITEHQAITVIELLKIYRTNEVSLITGIKYGIVKSIKYKKAWNHIVR